MYIWLVLVYFYWKEIVEKAAYKMMVKKRQGFYILQQPSGTNCKSSRIGHGRKGIILFHQHLLKNFNTFLGDNFWPNVAKHRWNEKFTLQKLFYFGIQIDGEIDPRMNEDSFRMTFFHYLKVCSLRHMVVNWEKKRKS